LRLIWQSVHPTACSHCGQPNQARRPRSAVGSIGNTASHPIRKHSGGHQVVVDTLLIVVKIGVQHRPCAVLLGEHFRRVPVVPDRLEDGGPAARLVKGQVVCECQMITLSSHLFSLCRHVERATSVNGRARGRQWPPSHSAVEVDHSFSTSQAVRRRGAASSRHFCNDLVADYPVLAGGVTGVEQRVRLVCNPRGAWGVEQSAWPQVPGLGGRRGE
jgi:hypothetical protein